MKHIICGLVSALMGIWGIIVWWAEFGIVMRGFVPFALLAFGIVGILAGLQAQQEESEKEDKDVSPEKAAEK